MKKKGLIWISVLLVISSLLLMGVGVWAYSEKNNDKEAVADSDSQITEDTQILEEVQTEISTELEPSS